jgi:thiamine pyrophosphokinase
MRVVIVANGVIGDPEGEFARWVDADTILVAADGGTKHLMACGHTPHHVIGDMDSIVPEVLADLDVRSVVFHQHPAEKDKTDLELALLWTAQHFAEAEITVLGIMGGRPDQTLANLLLLALPQLEDRNVMLVDGHWQVHLIRGREIHHFRGNPGDTLSLIPLGGKVEGVTTSGLHYPLNGETLCFGPARGISNEFTGEEASVKVESGMLWVFHRRSDE